MKFIKNEKAMCKIIYQQLEEQWNKKGKSA